MKKRITHESKKGFNQSSKIIAYKLGINASIILSSLIYKHNYWFDENKLKNIEGEYYFYITYSNLQAETTLKLSAIKKGIKVLKKANLIQVERKGVPATNHYCLNQETIANFETIHEKEYLSWIETLNTIAKADKNRFPEKKEIVVHEQIKTIQYYPEIEDPSDKIFQQLMDSIGADTHSSGLN